MAANPQIRAAWMGRVEYDEAYRLQLSLLERRKAGEIPDTLLLLEHPHVYTLGRRGGDEDLLRGGAELEAAGAKVVQTDRGGQATYHGPGQLICYAIFDLRVGGLGPVTYVRRLEEVIIGVLSESGVEGHRVAGKTGVWTYGSIRPDLAPPLETGEAKIAAIGVRISRGVAMHGFALNVSTELERFDCIVPCGMPEVRMASIRSICGEAPDMEAAASLAAATFGRVFERAVKSEKPESLAA
ncbi:MAG: lipoyl(octanoyl) transferase LipB [Chloroflexi bacterium]|nr:lipoyl(octanoyl) transferase LipB [Chloroflexota bacterium]